MHNDDLLTKLGELTQENARLKGRLTQLEESERYLWQLAANPNLSASQKWVMLALRRKLGRGREGEQVTRVAVWEIAKEVGLSRQSAGENVKKLAETGAVVREVHNISEGKGRIKKNVLVGMGLFSEHPESLRPMQPRNHGGRRLKCPSCGSEDIMSVLSHACEGCGHLWEEVTRQNKNSDMHSIEVHTLDRPLQIDTMEEEVF